MNQKNYLTVGEHENAVNKRWCLSVVAAKPIAQMKIKLNDGKAYNYFSKFSVQENDLAVIGNGLIGIDNIANEPFESTGQMGMVVGQATAKLNRSRTAELDFVFTPVVEKTHITACSKYLKVQCDKKTLCAGREVWNVYPITLLIRKLLAAVSVLAFPDLATKVQIEEAQEYLNEMYIIPEEAKTLTYTDFPKDRKTRWAKEDIHVYKASGKITGNDATVYKYIHIGAVSLMLRGGFVNMLQAYLNANPPIKAFYNTLVSEATQVGAPEAIEILKKYTPTK